MVKIILTNHAKYRLLERGIDTHQVKKIIKNGSIVKISSDGTIVVKGLSDGGKFIEVVYFKNGNNLVIKTAYYEG